MCAEELFERARPQRLREVQALREWDAKVPEHLGLVRRLYAFDHNTGVSGSH
jgi:hypothetical protein